MKNFRPVMLSQHPNDNFTFNFKHKKHQSHELQEWGWTIDLLDMFIVNERSLMTEYVLNLLNIIIFNIPCNTMYTKIINISEFWKCRMGQTPYIWVSTLFPYFLFIIFFSVYIWKLKINFDYISAIILLGFILIGVLTEDVWKFWRNSLSVN